jgi:levansucrase
VLTSNTPTSPLDNHVPSRWSAAQIKLLGARDRPEAPIITAHEAAPVIADMTFWDVWPVQCDDGSVAEISGGSLWVVLSAPRRTDPDMRHDEARMRLLHRVDGGWHDCGNLLPDGFSLGSREWSGSTRFDPESGAITLWFTAAGRRGEAMATFEQRIFCATGMLDLSGAHLCVTGWAEPVESITNDGSLYADLATTQLIRGMIKGFRDPYWFRDPATGAGYILFTGSAPTGASGSDFDGVIGIAAADDAAGFGGFTLLPPLIDARGLANELELPHILVRDRLYYLFWSTQSHIFAPDGPRGPTGLYGMVAPSLFGPYAPLNGSGLVIANPRSEPRQAYGWKVLPTLEVISFVDAWGIRGRDVDADPVLKAKQFGGTIAPMVRLALDGSSTRIVAADE